MPEAVLPRPGLPSRPETPAHAGRSESSSSAALSVDLPDFFPAVDEPFFAVLAEPFLPWLVEAEPPFDPLPCSSLVADECVVAELDYMVLKMSRSDWL